jgi:SAM-dependent methyltransferase
MIVEEMQTYYGKRAPEYDASMGYDDPEKTALLLPVITKIQSVLRGRSILEIACGPCFWTEQIAECANVITATDYNTSTLAQAAQKQLPWGKITLEQADAYQVDKIEGDFDAIFAVDWLSHVPREKMTVFLKQVVDRIPTGSPVVFVDQTPGPRSLTNVFDDHGNHIQARSIGDGSSFRVIKHFFSDEQIAEIFASFDGDLLINRFPECRRLVVIFTRNTSLGSCA